MTYEDEYQAPAPITVEEIVAEETPVETPVAPPAAVPFDPDAFATALAERIGPMVRQPAYEPPPKPDAPPSWDDFDGGLDEYVQAHLEFERKKNNPQNGIRQAMIAVQESQNLANTALSVPPEVAKVATQWFNQLPPEQLQPGVARAIIAHALGQYQLDQLTKQPAATARAPRAVADAGVPSGGYTSSDDAIQRAGMKAAFPHLSDKEITEIMRNNG
jgi:hypothetical protein